MAGTSEVKLAIRCRSRHRMRACSLLRRLAPHDHLVHQRGLLYQLLESRSRLDLVLVRDDEVHADVLQPVGSVVLGSHHYLHGVVDGDRLPDDVLTQRLEAVKEETLGGNQEMHRQVRRNVTNLVGVNVLEKQQEHRVRDIGEHNLFVGPRRLPHAPVEQRAEVLRAGREVRACGIHRLAVNQERDVREGRVVDELPEVVNKVAGGDGDRLEAELVEVIQHDAPVVSSKHVQRVVEYFRYQRRPATWGVLRAEHEPRVAVEAEFVQVIQPLLAAVAAEEEERIPIHHARVEVSRGGHLPGRSDRRPCPRTHPELVEVVHSMNAIVTTEEV
mmetsp:Transcript_127999/g.362300  ORF Transcript_127999/g.362300 Transcript_127999/m.362300 type:complete len:330 (+) Transcript_127999:116-1105(+)